MLVYVKPSTTDFLMAREQLAIKMSSDFRGAL